MSKLKELMGDGIDEMTITDSKGNSTTVTADDPDGAEKAQDAVGEFVKDSLDSDEIRIPPRPQQLSFNVGGEAIGKHLYGTIAVNGKLETTCDLNLGDELRVQIINAQSEVVAAGPAICSAPAFNEQTDKDGEIIAIERAHKAKVER